jgi:hypothetical protein
MDNHIAVTGHRFLTEMDAVVAGIDSALDAIRHHFPGDTWRIYTQLAEGADRLVIRRAQLFTEVDGTLHLVHTVVLPFSMDRYLQDFTDDNSRAEFKALFELCDERLVMPPLLQPEDGYLEAARYILGRCQLLVAIWDGRNAQGHGGTGEIVALARKKMIPIAWVRAGNRKPGTSSPVSLGLNQGRLTLERFPEIPDNEHVR